MAVKALISDKTCAILLEPVQGEGGVRPFEQSFLQDLRQLCDEQGIVLILDEVQTGVGRTGTFFAYEQYGIQPDLVAMAKGLANGVPIGAVLANQKIADVMGPGTHASTFGGNPLATAAGLATVKTILETDVLSNVKEMGSYLHGRLEELVNEVPAAKQVRGMGLLLGLVLDRPAGDVIKSCLQNGLLLTVAGGDAVRFTPPLIVTKQEIDHAVNILAGVLHELSSDH
jgi:acetylornithine/succinyldiaminopimelate/putrescine aminotransferase